jgi:hypothetical protein
VQPPEQRSQIAGGEEGRHDQVGGGHGDHGDATTGGRVAGHAVVGVQQRGQGAVPEQPARRQGRSEVEHAEPDGVEDQEFLGTQEPADALEQRGARIHLHGRGVYTTG